MKSSFKLFVLVFLLPFLSLAQSDYKPGYVVTLKGDTVRGLIDLRNWDSNPTDISFKSSAGAGVQKLTINDIKLFNIPDFVVYRRFVVRISLDETNTLHLVTGRDTSYKTDAVFLRELQRGKNIALYAYGDQIKMRYYVGEYPDYTPSELVYRLYLDNGAVSDNHGRSVNENTFLKQLFALAAKYNALDDELTREFQTASYVSSDLLFIVSKINGLSKKDVDKKYSESGSLNLFAGVALNVGSTTSSQGSYYLQGGGKNYTSVLPSVSLGINFVPNTITGKVQIRIGLQYTRVNFSSSYTLLVSPNVPVKATYNQTEYAIAPMILYNFYNAEKLKIYAGLGLRYTRYSYSNAHFGSQDPAVNDNGIGAAEPFYFNSSDDSFTGQVGIQIDKRFEIFANYATSTATTAGGYWQLNNQNTQVGFIYLFGK